MRYAPNMVTRMGRPPLPLAERIWQHLVRGGPDDCWLWEGGLYSNGYGRITDVTICAGQRKMALAHRAVWEAIKGPIPTGKALCHTCDTRYPVGDIAYRRCCNPDHMRPGDRLINMHDAIRSGRLHTRGDKRGVNSGRAKLTNAQVHEIRARYAAGERNAALARAYGLGTSAMHALVTRKTWAHI